MFYPTCSILASSSFIRSYSMSVSSKVICLVITGWVKERRKLPCGKSRFWVWNSNCVHWYGHTFLFFIWLDINSLFMVSRGCIYCIINNKNFTRCQLIYIWSRIFLECTWDRCKAKHLKFICSFIIGKYSIITIYFSKFLLIIGHYWNNQCVDVFKLNLGCIVV